MSFTLRKPVADDAVELAALHVECWKQTYTELLPQGFFSTEHAEHRLNLWQRILADPNPAFSLAVACNEQEDLICFSFAAPCTKDSVDVPAGIDRQLYNLYLLNDQHGSGAGQALLDAALGDQPALLWVAEQNPRAIAFYQRNGFSFDGQVLDDPTAPLITDLRMVRLPV